MKNFYFDVAIHLADTDATGFIFFPRLFEKCVIGLEFFLEKNHLRELVSENKFLFPVIHVQSQYLAPLRLYDKLKGEMSVTRIGQTSVTFLYKFIDRSGLLAAEASLVHVCVDPKTKVKKELPEAWIEIFKTLYSHKA